MTERKVWREFRDTGLLLIINQILHIFGWSVVIQMNDDVITDVYPTRVKYRGFSDASVDKSYKNITKYMKENSEELMKEVE